ncbi:hypothetical protein CHS0354_040332 [Potamilus streckersoni]|uniref:Sushi domain-containing protein n=1 Tax=Potamilus streckersoni TaxID=2493646 RepID=A0AAE0SG97_9BIVA|nr:hypothetical protein CHS0354_040332 [Potamilus streckersoni]
MRLFYPVMKAQQMYDEKTLILFNVWIVYLLFLQPSSSLEVICPAIIPNGNITMNDNCTRRIDSICKYKCNDGFRANPNISSVTCQDTGQWAGDISSLCQVYNCPAKIPNGTLPSACQRTVGGKCNYTCDMTFHPNASIPMITCHISGWEPDVATLCIEQDRGILVSFPAMDQLIIGDFYIIPTTMEGMPILNHSLLASFPVNQQLFSMAADYRLKHLFAYSHTQNGILLNRDFEMGYGGSTMYNLMHIGISSRYVKLAVDWVSHNVYWTDPNFNWIIMQNETLTDMDLYTIIIETDIDAPHGIAVDPITGFLFWSDIGHLAKIERSNLLGEDRHVLTYNLDFPISLAVDMKSNSLYWVDSIRETVEVCTYGGLNRRILIKDLSRKFLDIAILKDFLYVTDYAQKKLLYMNKTNDVLNIKGIGFYRGPVGVAVYNPDIQPLPSKAVLCPANCSDICVELPAGHHCLCREGYFYNESSNRCQENLGIFHRGILISNATSICVLDIRTLAAHQEYPLQCFLDASNVTFIAMNMAERQIFFANSTGIYYTSVDSSKIIQLIPLPIDISGLSLDWIDDNIYWCEKTTGKINVLSLNTRSSTTIVSDVVQPRDILVVPHYRKMFWISGKDNYTVQVSSLTGNATSTISNSSRNSEPHSLVFNPLSQVLFWIEGQMIKSYDLITNLTKANVINSLNSTLLSSYKNQLVWISNTSRPSVLFAYDLKLNTTPNVIASFSKTGQIGAMMIFDPILQPNEKGPCEELNGLCEHLCIPQGSYRVCRCDSGFTLYNETLCISDPVSEKFLLVSDWTHHKIYQLDLSTSNIHGIDVSFTKSPAGIAYDPRLQKLIWGSFDQSNNFITTAFLNGSNEKVLADIYSNALYPEQIAIDFSTGNIFFTAPARNPSVLMETGYIGVLSSNGYHSRKLIPDVDMVFDIVLHPKQGHMFWTVSGSYGCICRANMDGTNTVQIVSKTLSSPYGLTIDYKADILYWTDWNDQISSIFINGSSQNVLYQDYGSYLGDIVFGGGYLYTTAWHKPHITRISLANTSDVMQLFEHGYFGTLEGLAIYIGEEQPVNTLCANNNGNCSTFCLPTSVGRSCACNDDVDLLSDGLTCSDAIQCPARVWRGNISDVCTRNVGSQCGVVCDQGYKPLTSNMLLECQANSTSGVWNNMYPCKAITCPSSLPDTVISANCSLLLGTNCTYSCKNGYYDEGPGYISCIDGSTNGSKWSVESHCKAIMCPSSVPNTVISPNCSHLLGTNCTYTCESGYHDEGLSHITCVNDSKIGGKWSVDSPCKAIMCPSSVPNTVISPNCSHLLGTNCTYTCESGYHDEGLSHITCVNENKNGGKWSIDSPCKVFLPDNTKTEAHSDSSLYGATVGVPLIIVAGIAIVVLIIFTRRCRHSTALRQRLKEETDTMESTHYQDFSSGARGEMSGMHNSSYVTIERDNIIFHSGETGHEPEGAVRSASDSGPIPESVHDSDVSVCISDKKMLQEKDSNA